MAIILSAALGAVKDTFSIKPTIIRQPVAGVRQLLTINLANSAFVRRAITDKIHFAMWLHYK
ncbi:hypothetical protein ABC733_06915 [Mangrovibacter sp. SLW1]